MNNPPSLLLSVIPVASCGSLTKCLYKLYRIKYIDVYIPETRVLIEQKSIDKDLDRKMPQSDSSMRTPFEHIKHSGF